MQTHKCKMCWLWGAQLKACHDPESFLKLTQSAEVLLASKYWRPNFVGAAHNYKSPAQYIMIREEPTFYTCRFSFAHECLSSPPLLVVETIFTCVGKWGWYVNPEQREEFCFPCDRRREKSYNMLLYLTTLLPTTKSNLWKHPERSLYAQIKGSFFPLLVSFIQLRLVSVLERCVLKTLLNIQFGIHKDPGILYVNK